MANENEFTEFMDLAEYAGKRKTAKFMQP